MRVALFLPFAFFLFVSQASAEDIEGNWSRGDGNARVRIEHCGGKLCAVNTWIRDEEKQHEKVGDVLIFNVKASASGYDGTAYDPQRKLSLSAKLKLAGNSLISQGCILAGLWCKNMHWTRTK
jgi:uncharacterized protein (DUF2147 family)